MIDGCWEERRSEKMPAREDERILKAKRRPDRAAGMGSQGAARTMPGRTTFHPATAHQVWPLSLAQLGRRKL